MKNERILNTKFGTVVPFSGEAREYKEKHKGIYLGCEFLSVYYIILLLSKYRL